MNERMHSLALWNWKLCSYDGGCNDGCIDTLNSYFKIDINCSSCCYTHHIHSLQHSQDYDYLIMITIIYYRD